MSRWLSRRLRGLWSRPGSPELPPPPAVDTKDLLRDPDPQGAAGILLSDRIQFYAESVNLIYPFDETALRPASYTLHVGSEYILALPGKLIEGDLEQEQKVIIPPNGLIYIRFYEEVNIPYYLIARFNLRVKQVYRGLLLGTGPQVDPGFRGHLGCPIHNFTNEEKTLHFREPIATIDFEKTTPFGEDTLNPMNDSQLRDLLFDDVRRGVLPIHGLNRHRCLVFGEGRDRPLREYLPHAESVGSSVFALQAAVDKLRRDWVIFRVVAFGGGIVVLLTCAGIIFDAYRDLKGDVASLKETVGQIHGKLSAQPPIPQQLPTAPTPLGRKQRDGEGRDPLPTPKSAPARPAPQSEPAPEPPAVPTPR